MLKNVLLGILSIVLCFGLLFVWQSPEIVPEDQSKPQFIADKSLIELVLKLKKEKEFQNQYLNPTTNILEQKSVYQFKDSSPEYEKYKDVVGWGAVPHSVTRMRKSLEGKKIFDTIYINDRLGFRNSYKKKRDEHLYLLGGSNTYGIGVFDHNTLGSNLNSYEVHNMALEAAGPQQHLAYMQNMKWVEDELPKKGVMVYVFYHFHVDRVAGELQYLRSTKALSPRYILEGQSVVNTGKFKDSLRYKLLSLLMKSEVLSRIINGFQSSKDDDRNLFIAILKELKNEYLKKYPKGRFLIYIPNAYDWSSIPWKEKFINDLSNSKIESINGKVDFNSKNNYFEDMHLRANAHVQMSVEINDYLNSNNED